MIRGVKREAIPYILEDDRGSLPNEQTIFWIKPKRAHDSNLTVKRYAGAARDGRNGYKDFSVKKLDAADVEEFCSIVEKVERYGFSEDSPYYDKFEDGIVNSTTSKEIIAAIAENLSTAHFNEIIDVAADISKLESGRYVGELEKDE